MEYCLGLWSLGSGGVWRLRSCLGVLSLEYIVWKLESKRVVLVWPADGPEPTHSLRGEGLVGCVWVWYTWHFSHFTSGREEEKGVWGILGNKTWRPKLTGGWEWLWTSILRLLSSSIFEWSKHTSTVSTHSSSAMWDRAWRMEFGLSGLASGSWTLEMSGDVWSLKVGLWSLWVWYWAGDSGVR